MFDVSLQVLQPFPSGSYLEESSVKVYALLN